MTGAEIVTAALTAGTGASAIFLVLSIRAGRRRLRAMEPAPPAAQAPITPAPGGAYVAREYEQS